MTGFNNFVRGFVGTNGFRYAIMSSQPGAHTNQHQYQLLVIDREGNTIGTHDARRMDVDGGTQFQTTLGNIGWNNTGPSAHLHVPGGAAISLVNPGVTSLAALRELHLQNPFIDDIRYRGTEPGA